MEKERSQGITLIALVMTIVVLILLAAVSMNAILGQDGLLARANESKITQEKADIEDQIKLIYLKYVADKNDPVNGTNGNLTDILENKQIYNPTTQEINIKKLLERDKILTGNGSNRKDVYILEYSGDKYTIQYYNKDGDSKTLAEFTEI